MKILVLTSRFPYPLEKGDKLRIFYQIRELHRAGHHIHLISLAESDVKNIDYQEVKLYCEKITIFQLSHFSVFTNLMLNVLRGSKMPFQVAYFYSKKIQTAIQNIIEQENPDHIYCHLVRMSSYLETVNKPKTLDFMDAFGAGTMRRAEISNFFLRPFWKYEAHLMSDFECSMGSKFPFSIIISEQDKQRLLLRSAAERVVVVPNGVDTDFFDINYFEKNRAMVNKIYDICFVGNLGYYSNIEAIRFLVKKILPLLEKENPNIKILLAGARPTAEIKALENKNVKVVGWLDDIREAYAASRLLVAPLMHGIGQQNKILEAMAMNVPVITTSRVNNAIGAVSETDILLADTEGAFAEQIFKILKDIDLEKKISKNGRAFVEKKYSWTSATCHLIHLIENKTAEKQPN